VQRAVDTVLAENPRARSEVLLSVDPDPHRDHGHDGHGQEQRSGDGHKGRDEGSQPRGQDNDELRRLVQHPERPLLRVPDVGSVRVHLASGWQPRESMEQLASQQAPGQALPGSLVLPRLKHPFVAWMEPPRGRQLCGRPWTRALRLGGERSPALVGNPPRGRAPAPVAAAAGAKPRL